MDNINIKVNGTVIGQKKINNYSIASNKNKEQTAIANNSGNAFSNTDESEGVKLEISAQAQKIFQENERRTYMDQLEREREAAEKSKDGMNDFAKIIETARRIARGDKVPAKDEMKLIEYSSDMYEAAKAAAAMRENEKHKKRKSLYEDEDEKEFEDKIKSLNEDNNSSSNIMQNTVSEVEETATDDLNE